jgi:hypothetical protein
MLEKSLKLTPSNPPISPPDIASCKPKYHWIYLLHYFPALHFSEQYLTLSQSRAHFLRHSKGRPQRWQILGGKPFLVFAITREG